MEVKLEKGDSYCLVKKGWVVTLYHTTVLLYIHANIEQAKRSISPLIICTLLFACHRQFFFKNGRAQVLVLFIPMIFSSFQKPFLNSRPRKGIQHPNTPGYTMQSKTKFYTNISTPQRSIC